jgi:hypothetical protein
MRRPGALLGWIAVGALAVPATAVSAAPPDTCARADALLAAGYVDDAERVYKALLGRESCQDTNGKSGVERVAGARAAKAKATQAHQARLNAFNQKVATVRRLEAEGFEEEARKQAQAIVEEYKKPLPADVRSLTQRTPEWREFLGRTVPDVRSAAEILAVFLGVLAVAVLAFRLLGNVLGRFRKTVRPSALTV